MPLILLRLLVLSLALAGGGSGCTKDEKAPPQREYSLASRMIQEEPTRLFPIDEFFENSSLETWTFQQPSALESWELKSGEIELNSADEAILTPHERLVRMDHPVDLSCSAIQAVEFGLDAPGGEVFLLWAQEGEAFSPSRRVPASKAGPNEWLAWLGDHPQCTGRITRLRLDFWTKESQLILRDISLVALRPRQDLQPGSYERAWRADLGSEVRDALFAPPGSARRWTLQVPAAGGLLAFGYGVERLFSPALTFQVKIRAPRSRGSLSVYAESISHDSADQRPGMWHEATFDLAEYSGTTIEVEFSTTSDTTAQPVDLSFWTDPRLLVQTSIHQPNILLVVIDTLRADHLSLYGYARNTSPFLDSWARDGVTFKTVVSPTPWTLPSHVSLFSGMGPLAHGLNFDDPVPDDLPLLAESLRKNGYRTLAVTGGGYLHPRYRLHRGFDVFHYWRRASSIDQERELDTNVDLAIRWLQQHHPDRPFFMFFHTYEVHSPFLPRQPYFNRFHVDESPAFEMSTKPVQGGAAEGFQVPKKFVRAENGQELPGDYSALAADLYDSEIAYADKEISRLLSTLRELGIEGETIVVLTSDHGEALGEKGLAGHAYLYDFNLLVPLVISAPGMSEPGLVVEEQVELTDILPTILELANVEVPREVTGMSLVPLLTAGPVTQQARTAWSYASSSNFGISLRLPGRYKYIYQNTAWPVLAGSEELFRLDSDPEEDHDLAAVDPYASQFREEVVSRLKNDLPGLRVRVTNTHQQQAIRIILSGPLVQPLRVKTVGRAPSMMWQEETLQVSAPPNTEFTLIFEGLAVGDLDLSIRQPNTGEALDHSLSLENLDSPWRAELEAGEWKSGSVDAAKEAEIGVEVWWVGRRFSGITTEDIVDPDLRKRLQALGYVE